MLAIRLFINSQSHRIMGSSFGRPQLWQERKNFHVNNGNDSLRNDDDEDSKALETTPSILNIANIDANIDANDNANNNNRNSNNERKSAKDFDPNSIKVQVNAYIEDKPTAIEEASSIFVKYKTPSFKAEAAVLVPEIPSSEHWKIGWVQACHKMKFVNIYGRLGMTSWEFPELNRGLKMLSDSDGLHFPWYGNRNEVQSVYGPTRGKKTFNIRMSDSFSPQITWVPPNGDRFMNGDCKLTEIHRDQSFHSWVVARNEDTKQVVPLKTVIWRMQVNIGINPDMPLGKRSKLLGPIQQIQPEVLGSNVAIPPNALDPPHANAAQMLLWRPAEGRKSRGSHRSKMARGPAAHGEGHPEPIPRGLRTTLKPATSKRYFSLPSLRSPLPLRKSKKRAPPSPPPPPKRSRST